MNKVDFAYLIKWFFFSIVMEKTVSVYFYHPQLGMSPLHFAARNGHFQTAEVLLRAGISRDARTKVDRTPLHVASQEGHVPIVDLLLSNSADIEAKDMVSFRFVFL